MANRVGRPTVEHGRPLSLAEREALAPSSSVAKAGPGSMSLRRLIGTGYDGGWYTNEALNPCRYRLFCGGRNTKKSEDIMGVEPVMKILGDPDRNIIMARQNYSDVGQTCYANLVNVIGRMGLTDAFEFRTSPYKITRKMTGQSIVFRGFNTPTSITSVKFERGYLTDVYIEEASELSSYQDFRVLDGSVRGVLPRGMQHQITLCMNTWSEDHWIYKEFFSCALDDGGEEYLEAHPYREAYVPTFNIGFGFGLYVHQSTFRINEFRDPSYDLGAEIIKRNAPEQYRVEFLGMWGHAGEGTYPEWPRMWSRLSMTNSQIMSTRYARYAIGIDTGLSRGDGRLRKHDVRAAMVMILVGITADYSEIHAIDEWFFTNEGRRVPKTEAETIRDMVDTIIAWRGSKYVAHPDLFKGNIPVYIDSASTGFIDNFTMQAQASGLYAARVYKSTKMLIQSRVDFERFLMGWEDIKVSDWCRNLSRELMDSHVGPDGSPRANGNDHAINAWEYAWAPMRAMVARWRNFKEHN